MIEEICNHLRTVDAFEDLSPQDVHAEPLQTLAHSEVYRIRVDSPPASLILKKSGASDVTGLAERERLFYRHIAPLLPDWLVPECVLIVDGDQTGRLLIRDLSGSHHSANGPEPTRLQCRWFVEALATLHGLTAGHAAIRDTWTSVATELPAGTLEQRLGFFRLVLEPFIAMIRDRVDQEVVGLLAGLHDLEHQMKRMVSQAEVLVHGDAHFSNALFSPRSRSRACLIDWAMPVIGFGEIDLAHSLALNLPRHLRREWEEEMLDAYLDQRSACGPRIEKAACFERYRTAVLYSLVSPVVWWSAGVPESQWWPALTNSLDASRDLGLLK